MHCSSTILDSFLYQNLPFLPCHQSPPPSICHQLVPRAPPLPHYSFTHPAHSINSTLFSTRFTLVVSFLTQVLAMEHFEKTYIVLWRCIIPPIFASFYSYSSESHYTTRVWGDSSTTHVLSYIFLGMHTFCGRLYTSKYRLIFAECTPLLVSHNLDFPCYVWHTIINTQLYTHNAISLPSISFLLRKLKCKFILAEFMTMF